MVDTPANPSDSATDASRTNASTGERPSQASALPIGTRVGRYIVVETLGQGGMGIVYKAYDPELNRRVALKMLTVRTDRREGASVAKTRLIREAQALAQISHPHVVAIHDVGTYGDDVFIAMELIEGQTLRAWVKTAGPPVEKILQVMREAGLGVWEAHKKGLVHRDFKPENVIIGHDGRVAVLDFGLALAVGQEGSDSREPPSLVSGPETAPQEPIRSGSLATPLTEAGTVVGTTAYMAPEQHLRLEVDARTDQFAFAITLFEALYGQRPFQGRTARELKQNLIHNRMVIPAGNGVPGWIEAILKRALSVSPADRYPSMQELLDALGDDPEARRARARALRQRNLLVATVLVLLVFSLGVLVVALRQGGQLCQGAAGELLGVWDAQTKAVVQKSLLATGKSYAAGTFAIVAERLDGYTTQWREMHAQACLATRVRGEQSEQVLDLRMICLGQRRRELKALTQVLARADEVVLSNAAQAVYGLRALGDCADVVSLLASARDVRPPSSPAQQAAVEDLRSRLAEVAALEKTGQYKVALPLAAALRARAREVGYRPVLAEAMSWHGRLQDDLGQYEEAVSTLERAYLVALEQAYFSQAARAAIDWMYTVGYRLARHQEGHRISRHAKAVLSFLPHDEEVRARYQNHKGVLYFWEERYDRAEKKYLEALRIREAVVGNEHPEVAATVNNLGLLYNATGQFDKAEAMFLRAIAIWEKTLGSKHPNLGVSLSSLGLLYANLGKMDKAAHAHRRSLEIVTAALGPEHPIVAGFSTNVADAFLYLGKLDEAEGYYRRALAIWEKNIGAEHPDVTWGLNGLGWISLLRQRPAEAIAPFEKALDICAKQSCETELLSRARAGLSQALSRLGRNPERVRALATLARDDLVRQHSVTAAQHLAEVNALLPANQTPSK